MTILPLDLTDRGTNCPRNWQTSESASPTATVAKYSRDLSPNPMSGRASVCFRHTNSSDEATPGPGVNILKSDGRGEVLNCLRISFVQ